jgi:hypothetical protein
MTTTLAFLKDAADFIRDVMGDCTVLVSDVSNQEEMQKHIFYYQRWLPLVLRIEGQNQQFSLKIWRNNKKQDNTLFRANYTVHVDSITLNSLQFVDNTLQISPANNQFLST